MKKLFLLAAAVMLAVAVQPAQDVQAAVDGDQVAICHFNGHDGDFVITGRGLGCLNQGGNPIVVGIKACERGHAASGNCARDNVAGCEFCKANPGGGTPGTLKDEH